METLRSIKHAPAAFPILTAEQWQQVDELHANRHHGPDVRRLRELSDYVGTRRFNFNTARAYATGQRPDTRPKEAG